MINLRSASLLLGLTVLLTSLSLKSTNASASNISGNHPIIFSISDSDIKNLLNFYDFEEETASENIMVKIYNKNDDLIYSTKVCPNLDECDDRLNQFINQSDFITEVDNIQIYILSH